MEIKLLRWRSGSDKTLGSIALDAHFLGGLGELITIVATQTNGFSRFSFADRLFRLTSEEVKVILDLYLSDTRLKSIKERVCDNWEQIVRSGGQWTLATTGKPGNI